MNISHCFLELCPCFFVCPLASSLCPLIFLTFSVPSSLHFGYHHSLSLFSSLVYLVVSFMIFFSFGYSRLVLVLSSSLHTKMTIITLSQQSNSGFKTQPPTLKLSQHIYATKSTQELK